MDANSTEPGHHEFRDADGKWWSDSEKNKCELARLRSVPFTFVTEWAFNGYCHLVKLNCLNNNKKNSLDKSQTNIPEQKKQPVSEDVFVCVCVFGQKTL